MKYFQIDPNEFTTERPRLNAYSSATFSIIDSLARLGPLKGYQEPRALTTKVSTCMFQASRYIGTSGYFVRLVLSCLPPDRRHI